MANLDLVPVLSDVVDGRAVAAGRRRAAVAHTVT
jgi:hypothetical protein